MRAQCCIIIFIFLNNFYNYCFGLNTTQQVLENSETIVSNSNEGVSETQYATCRISTEELVANAQATVTRVLTGVCSAEVVDARFQNLERLIKQELDEIKLTLNSLVGLCTQKTFGSAAFIDPRQEEIDRLNNTISTINTAAGVERTFLYFMRVKDFDQKTSRWEPGWYERSSTFYLPLRRYAMYMKVTPRDVQGETTYMNIGAGLAQGVFDEALDWPFPLKHQVEILDHSAQGFRRDLRASIVDPLTSGSSDHWTRPSILKNGENREQTGLAIPVSFILTDSNQSWPNSAQNVAKYLWNGDLVVKLTVYL